MLHFKGWKLRFLVLKSLHIKINSLEIRILKTFLIFFIIIFFLPLQLAFSNTFSLIRDTEIENTIRTYVIPLLKAARLDPNAIKVFIVKDEALNAFVAGGQKIFINSGLITRSTNANQIIGVLAHEVGHISGGHLSRTRAALSRSSVPAILAYILGGAATIATKRSDLGSALIIAGKSASQRTFLKYSRLQESAADQAALKYLDATNQSARGLLKFLENLNKNEFLNAVDENVYLRSHPLSKNRIKVIKNHLKKTPFFAANDNQKNKVTHARVRAKLLAFLQKPSQTLTEFNRENVSIPSIYAQAIAHHKNSEYTRAIDLIDKLISEDPGDPYFRELKAQILFKSGQADKALDQLNKVIKILPTAPLIRQLTGLIQLKTKNPKFIEAAIENLRVAVNTEPNSANSWRQLAIAYSRKGDTGNKALALAETALLNDKIEMASYHAGHAAKIFSEGTREWLHSQDIINTIKSKRERSKRKNR